MSVPARLGAGAIRVAKTVADVKAVKVLAAKEVIDNVDDAVQEKGGWTAYIADKFSNLWWIKMIIIFFCNHNVKCTILNVTDIGFWMGNSTGLLLKSVYTLIVNDLVPKYQKALT